MHITKTSHSSNEQEKNEELEKKKHTYTTQAKYIYLTILSDHLTCVFVFFLHRVYLSLILSNFSMIYK